MLDADPARVLLSIDGVGAFDHICRACVYIILAYFDDIYIICNRHDTYACYMLVRDILKLACHIDVHIRKLVAWSMTANPPPNRISEIGSVVWKPALHAASNGVKVLGAPVGSRELIIAIGLNVFSDEVQPLGNIPKLVSLQIAWLLLYCCAVPRVNHLLRTISPNMVRPIADSHDRHIFTTFCNAFHICISSHWPQQLHGVSQST